MDQGPLVMSPYNVNRAVREKVMSHGVKSLLPRERAWWNDMMRREQDTVRMRAPILSNYYTASVASKPPPVMMEAAAVPVLNRRLKSTLRRAGAAKNRRTQRQLWKELANIGLEYQQQGQRFSERVRELKAELNAPKPIPVQRPVKPMSSVIRPTEETYREPPRSWREMTPLRGGRRTKKYRGRK